MKFLHNKLIIKILFFFIFSVWINSIFANLSDLELGNPYVERISLKSFGLKNYTYSIVQDDHGLFYIASSNGILIFDGKNTHLVKVKGNPIITKSIDSRIYIASLNQLGYLGVEENGNLNIISLQDSSYSFGQPDRLFTKDGHIFFSTEKGIYHWFQDKLTQETDNTVSCELLSCKDEIFLYNENAGLFRFDTSNFSKIFDCRFLPGEIQAILPSSQGYLIKISGEGFFLLSKSGCKKFSTQADEFIRRHEFKCAVQTSSNDYAIGTRTGGVIIIDQEGNYITIVDKVSELFDTKVNFLLTDQQDNIWALHDQGLSRIEYPSAFTYFNHNQDLKGEVECVVRFEKRLYVATSQGVFYLSELNKNKVVGSTSRFLPVKGITSHGYEFHIVDDKLFASTAFGIYEINETSSKLFYNRERESILTSLHSKKYPSIIFLGRTDGFSALRYTNEILIIQDKVQGIDDRITSIIEEDDGTVWLSCELGVYYVQPFIQYSSDLRYIHYTKENGLPDFDWIHLFLVDEKVVFSTSEGLFKYNKDSREFYKDSVFIQKYLGGKSEWIFPIAQDQNNNIWLNVIGRNGEQSRTFVLSKVFSQRILQYPVPLNRIKGFNINSILPDEDSIIWFGGFEGIARFDAKKISTKQRKVRAYISSVRFASDSIFVRNTFSFVNEAFNENSKVPYYINSLSINLSSDCYESEEFVHFSTWLEGYEDSWSDWNQNSSREYTNLREGGYTFRVQAKDIYGNISDIEEYTFNITPPFYRTVYAYISYLIFVILFVLLLIRWRAYYFARERFKLENIINERTEEVVIQKEKADSLLERVLPKDTAQELKSGKRAGPYHYKMVTVLFSDIQGFTKISEQLDSEHLIDELDKFFLKFDSVVEKYNIEKIKTIGDAYMCAGGIPEKNRTNPVEVILAAIEMQTYMKTLKHEGDSGSKKIWDLRIGVDTGPVVAGVLGRSKISYDIWGGTVNTASRMEASGEPGKVNITENTYMLIKEFFICKYRGKMPVKYKGEIDMYFVEGFMPHLASDLKQQIPNEKFFTHLQLLRINDIEEYLLEKLENGLPSNLYYHDVKHTIDVVTQVELIGRSEGVSDNEMLLLRTAALFHDMGHLVDYDTHEEEGTKLAQKLLPKYHYSEEQIEQVCRLIKVTQMPPKPTNLMEEIMCDADLDYLGRTDFVPVSNALFKEYYERGKIESLLEWNHHQYDFINNHYYFTNTAQNLREVNKKNQLENIQNEIQRMMNEEDNSD